MNNTSYIYENDNIYPKRVKQVLNKKAPERFAYLGNLDLLNKKAVGFCGSRNASEIGKQIATNCVHQMALKDVVAVSGYAAGVDLTVHIGALKFGGTTIIVLPEGIDNFRIKKEIEPYWNWEKVLVVSQFPDNTVWKSYHAMSRNATIVALSSAMIVIEAGEKGGTLNAGNTTLKSQTPLFVVEYADNTNALGNKELLSKGGIPLRGNSKKQAHTEKLFEILESPSYFTYNQTQLSLI